MTHQPELDTNVRVLDYHKRRLTHPVETERILRGQLDWVRSHLRTAIAARELMDEGVDPSMREVLAHCEAALGPQDRGSY